MVKMNKIALFSVPRSGSTWLGQIFNSHPKVLYRFQPNFAYSFDYSLTEHNSTEEIAYFYEKLINTQDPFVNAKLTISSKQGLSFQKVEPTTLVFKETHYINVIQNLIEKTDTKVVGLVRSPFSVINSWLKLPKEFNKDWSVKEEWYDAPSKNDDKAHYFFGFKKWKEATALFLKLEKEYSSQFYLLSYDSLLQNKMYEVKRVFDFCDLSFDEQTQNFLIQASQKEDQDPYSVFKQKTEDNKWENELPRFIIDEIKEDKEFQKLNSIFQWI